MMSAHRAFTEHPHSIGETYLEHQRHAFAFGATMVLAGLACILHGLVPAVFLNTGSRAVARLHGRMVSRLADGQGRLNPPVLTQPNLSLHTLPRAPGTGDSAAA